MLTCPRCGFHNMDDTERCMKCQALLITPEKPLPKVKVRRDPTALGAGMGRLWRRATGWMVPTLPTDVALRHPPTAAVVSFLPGAGQLYNRQPLKALWGVLLWITLAVVAGFTFTTEISHLTFGLFILSWIGLAADAMASSARINGQLWTRLIWWRGFFAVAFFMACIWGLLMLFLSPITYFRLIGDDTFAPVIHRNDIVWIDKTVTWFGRDLQRGDLIYYDPEGFRMDRGNNTIFYNAKSYIERVIGLPGEHVTLARENGEVVIQVDGQTLPPSMHPISTEYLPLPLEYDIPDDQWLIMQSKTMDENIALMAGGQVAPSLAGADVLEPQWRRSNLVSRDQIIGRVYAIAGPPTHRRWFPRGAVDTDGR